MKWAIRISNSHRKLSQIEIETLIPEAPIKWIMPLLAIVEVPQEVINRCTQYAGSIKFIVYNPIFLDYIETKDQETPLFDLETLENNDLNCLSKISTFAARFYPILHEFPKHQSLLLERVAGGKILEANFELQVNLRHPDQEFGIFGYAGGAIAGWIYRKLDFATIAKISPKESPFFGGGAMKPLLSKILVNYLYPFPALIFDPFSGHGGMLRQISDHDLYAIGFEVSSKIARECKINNEYHRLDFNIEIIMADATRAPVRKHSITKVVTDPPYAIQTTTKGLDRTELVLRWLKTLDLATEVVLTLPTTIDLGELPRWNIIFKETDYVHRSLTRIARKMVKIQ